MFEIKPKHPSVRSSNARPGKPGMATTTQRLALFYSVADVAHAFGISTKTVRRKIESGELRAHRIGGQLRISADDLQAYIALSRT